MDEERAPLLQKNEPSAPPAPASDPNYVTCPPIGPDELPPPYSPSPQGGTLMVNCRVCSAMIDISGKKDQHVVKCNSCSEATPIRNAPPGKKYVRCPCNCLLICKTSSQRIACPRPNCKRVINLTPNPVAPTVSNIPGMCSIICGHCESTFLFNTLTNALARCPHCRKVSTVGPEYARSRGLIFLVISLMLLIVSIGVTAGTVAISSGGIYVLYVAGFVAFILTFIRALYYFTMKVSAVEGPV